MKRQNRQKPHSQELLPPQGREKRGRESILNRLPTPLYICNRSSQIREKPRSCIACRLVTCWHGRQGCSRLPWVQAARRNHRRAVAAGRGSGSTTERQCQQFVNTPFRQSAGGAGAGAKEEIGSQARRSARSSGASQTTFAPRTCQRCFRFRARAVSVL